MSSKLTVRLFLLALALGAAPVALELLTPLEWRRPFFRVEPPGASADDALMVLRNQRLLDGSPAGCAPAGDVDGDGCVDTFHAGTSPWGEPGTVALLSGRTGATLFQWDVPDHTRTPYDLDVVGDLSQDGVPDVFIRENRGRVGTGECAWIVSGRDGETLRDLQSIKSTSARTFGVVADVDGDGLRDLVELSKRKARVVSSSTLSPLHELGPADRANRSGYDVDGDGTADVLLASKTRVRAVSGATGNELLMIAEPLLGAVAVPVWLPDVDGDGVADVAVGYPDTPARMIPEEDDVQPPNARGRGLVRVYSGATGARLFEIPSTAPRSHVGLAVAALDDLSGDGVPELAVGAPGTTGHPTAPPGVVRVHSGADGTWLFELSFAQSPDSHFGRTLVVPGDMDGDGHSELVVGEPGATGPAGLRGSYLGALWVIRGTALARRARAATEATGHSR